MYKRQPPPPPDAVQAAPLKQSRCNHRPLRSPLILLLLCCSFRQLKSSREKKGEEGETRCYIHGESLRNLSLKCRRREKMFIFHYTAIPPPPHNRVTRCRRPRRPFRRSLCLSPSPPALSLVGELLRHGGEAHRGRLKIILIAERASAHASRTASEIIKQYRTFGLFRAMTHEIFMRCGLAPSWEGRSFRKGWST